MNIIINYLFFILKRNIFNERSSTPTGISQQYNDSIEVYFNKINIYHNIHRIYILIKYVLNVKTL